MRSDGRRNLSRMSRRGIEKFSIYMIVLLTSMFSAFLWLGAHDGVTASASEAKAKQSRCPAYERVFALNDTKDATFGRGRAERR